MDEVVRSIGTPILGLAVFALWGIWSLIRRLRGGDR